MDTRHVQTILLKHQKKLKSALIQISLHVTEQQWFAQTLLSLYKMLLPLDSHMFFKLPPTGKY